MADIIDLRNVSKVYGTVIKTKVLHNINLSIEEHSFNSIIGASGSGKSTLLNIIGALDKPTEGEVTIGGLDVMKLGKNQLAELRNDFIGFIFQFHYLLPEFTALENILMPHMIKNGRIAPQSLKRAEELLELIGLSEIKNRMPANMSGGQQQRVAIARSLINNPRIVLADEPTGNLDSETSENVYGILRKINRELKTTFVIVTHDDRIAEKTDRTTEIKDGRIHMDFCYIPKKNILLTG